MIHPDGGGRQPIAVGPGFTNPRWSPDGTKLLSYNASLGGMILDLAAGFGAPVKQELPPVAPGVLFWAIAWSPDGALVAGSAVSAGRVGDIYVWSIADRAYRRMPWSRTGQADYSQAFIDRDHLVYAADGDLWLGDLRGGEPRLLYRSPPGHSVANISAASDGHTITWIDNADESDIWLMTLADGPAAQSR